MAGTACTRPATQQAGESGAIRISVGVDPSYAPFFLAEQEGMFEAAGLDGRIVQTEGGAASAQNVVAGTSEMSGDADTRVGGVRTAERPARGCRPDSGSRAGTPGRHGTPSGTEFGDVTGLFGS